MLHRIGLGVLAAVLLGLLGLGAGGVRADSSYQYVVFAHCEQEVSTAGIGSLHCDTPLSPPLSPVWGTNDSGLSWWRFGVARCAYFSPFSRLDSTAPSTDASQNVWLCSDPSAGTNTSS